MRSRQPTSSFKSQKIIYAIQVRACSIKHTAVAEPTKVEHQQKMGWDWCFFASTACQLGYDTIGLWVALSPFPT
jgi:hypothetical protein